MKTLVPDRSKGWSTFVLSFIFLFTSTNIVAFMLFFGVRYFVFGNTPYASPIYISLGFKGANISGIADHSFEFLGSISLIFALCGAVWTVFVALQKLRFSRIHLLVVPWIAMILTSPIWGYIWSIYHWQSSQSYDSATKLYFYKHDMIFGLQYGWLSAIQSFPINILSYITVCLLLIINKNLFLRKDLAPVK